MVTNPSWFVKNNNKNIQDFFLSFSVFAEVQETFGLIDCSIQIESEPGQGSNSIQWTLLHSIQAESEPGQSSNSA